jgi:protein TonB
MPQAKLEWSSDRAKAAIGAGAFHILIGYALITGLGVDLSTAVGDRLKLFEVSKQQQPPPIEQPPPAESRSSAPEAAAAPPSLKAEAAPIVAPPPKIRLEVPPPLPTARVTVPIATGRDRSAGAAPIDRPGTGSGGTGTGMGSGRGGNGSGSGGPAVRARRVMGALGNSDYPKAAKRAEAGGTVLTRYTIGMDGRVQNCVVTQSSGNAELDSTTCRLVRERYRYAPARDTEGRPVTDVQMDRHIWWTEKKNKNLLREPIDLEDFRRASSEETDSPY